MLQRKVVVKKVKSVYLKKSNKSVLTRKVPGLITRDACLIHTSLIHQQYKGQSLHSRMLYFESLVRIDSIHVGSVK